MNSLLKEWQRKERLSLLAPKCSNFAQLKALLDSEHLTLEDGKKLYPFEWPQTMAQQIDRFNKYGGGGMKHSSDTHLDEKLFEEKLLAQVADPVDFVLCVQNIGLALNPPAGNDTAEDFPVFQFVLSLLFFSWIRFDR